MALECGVASVDNVYVQTVPVMEDMSDLHQAVYYTGTNNNTQVSVISGHS